MAEGPVADGLREATRLFNAGEYHAAHEVLDELWEATQGPDADFFKGLLQASVAIAVLTSSLLFGLLHTQQGIVGVLLTTLDGLVFAVLRFRLGTVWAPVLAHGFNNTIGFVAFFFLGPVYGLW